MSLMKISISPKNKNCERSFIKNCIRLANERNVICQIKPREAIVEGKKETILEILRKLDKDSLNWVYKADWPKKVLEQSV